MKYKVGNLVSAALAGEVMVVLDQRNTQACMRSGIAKELAERVPGLELQDSKWCKHFNRDPKLILGSYSRFDYKDCSFYGLYGQAYPSTNGRQTNYGALFEAMVNIGNEMCEWNLPPSMIKIGIPKIGCGVAKGDWSVVSEVLEFIFRDFDVTVYVLNEKEIPPGATRV